MSYNSNSYNLFIEKNQDKYILKYFDIELDTEVTKFKAPLTSKIHKIYIITQKDDILYIGKTINPIRTKLKNGLNPKQKNQYRYQWKDETNLTLFVYCFPYLTNEKQIENIEAELAFFVRLHLGVWPTKQNEIHFNNLYPNGREYAEQIFKEITNKIQ